MANRIRYVWCRSCDQGWLYVYKRLESGALFLECDECGAGWDHPQDAVADVGGFFAVEIPGRDAAMSEIVESGWSTVGFKECSE